MSERLDSAKLSPELNRAYYAFSMATKDSGLGQTLIDLVNIRTSQINGCAFCVDMHSKEAKIHGERELRLYHVAIWRESNLFDARERAALAKQATRGLLEAVRDRVALGQSSKERAR